MRIHNGRVAGAVGDGEISIVDGTITSHHAGMDTKFDAAGGLLAPGLIDIQINGAFGHDFSADPASIWDVGEMLPRHGVTSFVPTLVTSPAEVFDHAIHVVTAGPPPGYAGANPVGLHFEGPWLSPQMKGAHNPDDLSIPDESVASKWAESNVVSMVTMAPELPGAEGVSSILAGAGVVVSFGHSTADYEQASAALNGDWSAVTHLFNQMTPFLHRDPGAVGAAWLSNAVCGLIVDGLHSDPDAVRMAWRILGPDRTVLISDSMAAAGLGSGSYRLGSVKVSVDDSGPRIADHRLAGSVLSLPEAVFNLTKWSEASIDDALASATKTPARLLGLADRGEVLDGLRGDIVVLTDSLDVMATFVGGSLVYKAGAS